MRYAPKKRKSEAKKIALTPDITPFSLSKISTPNPIIKKNIPHTTQRSQVNIITAILNQVIVPNLVVDEFATEIAKKNAQNAVKPYEVVFKKGQKIVFETENGGLKIECNASRTVAMIGIFELMNYMGLKKCLNILAALHGLKHTDMIDTIVKGGNLSSIEEMEVMKELLNKSPEEIEKLKEQLDV